MTKIIALNTMANIFENAFNISDLEYSKTPEIKPWVNFVSQINVNEQDYWLFINLTEDSTIAKADLMSNKKLLHEYRFIFIEEIAEINNKSLFGPIFYEEKNDAGALVYRTTLELDDSITIEEVVDFIQSTIDYGCGAIQEVMDNCLNGIMKNKNFYYTYATETLDALYHMGTAI
ncbi:MAG: hypothetical protein ACOYCB_04660 [Fastidiosipilaceae bacterium]|jgi:hypothetical protein|nr:hypothetical protein [Clostridiaceae bacterium]